MTAYFPLFTNLEHKKFRIFGAGRVAARRIPCLLEHGAEITVVAPQIGDVVLRLYGRHPDQFTIEQRSYHLGEIQNESVDYVLAATDDDKVNTDIYRECRHKEIPVNNASDRNQCDFYFPALVERDNLIIGITSTDGNHEKVAQVSDNLRRLDHLYENVSDLENCNIRIVHVRPY